MTFSSQQTEKNFLIAILGPTASGKSSLAIAIAQQYNGEIISVDSRQIYRGMDIGTGKVTHEEMQNIPHHLLDIADPNDEYNVTDFVRDAQTAISDIQSRGKLPILCGGTGFWAQALLTGQSFPTVPPDPALRAKLSQLTAEELFAQLEQLNPERAATIDRHNPVRLIRAIEIALHCHPALDAGSRFNCIQMQPGSPIESGMTQNKQLKNILHFIIVLNPSMETLREKIKTRLDERFNQGMIEEVQRLHEQGVRFEKLEAFGLEYRWIARYLQHKFDEKTMREKLYFDIVHYAKRQLTWLRRWERQGETIHWFTESDEALPFIKNSLSEK